MPEEFDSRKDHNQQNCQREIKPIKEGDKEKAWSRLGQREIKPIKMKCVESPLEEQSSLKRVEHTEQHY